MTTAHNSKTVALSVANTFFQTRTELYTPFNVGQAISSHGGYWILNLSNTTTEVVWVRTDGIAAVVEGDDCYAVRAQERIRVQPHDVLSAIAAIGTPKILIAGDIGGQIIYA